MNWAALGLCQASADGSHLCLPAVAPQAFTSLRIQAELVERFVVVHGQIILNQFKTFPKKSVANSAFVSGLKGKMELRRHCKLYAMPRPKARVRVRIFPCPYIPSQTEQCSSQSVTKPKLLCLTILRADA